MGRYVVSRWATAAQTITVVAVIACVAMLLV
jgi:hypothetical protein